MLGTSLFDECADLIKKWQPQKYPTESEYKKDLRKFLFEKLNKRDFFSGSSRNINVNEESSRSLCDLGINRIVGIELKFGKNGKISKSERDRLHGQCYGHRKEYSEGVIVVLVGDINDYSEADVKETLRGLSQLINGGFGLNQYKIGLVNKSHTKIQKQKPKSQNPFEFNFRSPF